MKFPEKGESPAVLLDRLHALKANDVPWAEGRAFAYIYDAGPEAMGLLKDSFSMFMTENGLDPTSFPSCMELERDVISAALDLHEAGVDARGTFTSGGTESILLSVMAARNKARAEKDITKPELLLPETAHAAFFKACQYFDIKPVRVPVDPETFKADPDAMDAAVSDNTIMMVGSAVSYAHGVVDPIEELGQVALKHGILLHIDCCVGGMYLPFAKKLGYDIPAFNLSVPGVTQLSMDFHKWGYAAKGASCVLYNDGEAMRRYQIFSWSGWTGYSVVNPTIMSTKSGGPVAACWAILQHIGEEGYLKLNKATQEASEKIKQAIHDIDGLELLGDPKVNLFSFTATDFDIFALADAMKAKNWYIQPQFGFGPSPGNIHLSVGASNAPHTDEFIADLKSSVDELREKAKNSAPVEIPAELVEMLNNASPEIFESLMQMIGGSGSELPKETSPMNNLLNKLPHETRDMLISEYINKLYTAQT